MQIRAQRLFIESSAPIYHATFLCISLFCCRPPWTYIGCSLVMLYLQSVIRAPIRPHQHSESQRPFIFVNQTIQFIFIGNNFLSKKVVWSVAPFMLYSFTGIGKKRCHHIFWYPVGLAPHTHIVKSYRESRSPRVKQRTFSIWDWFPRQLLTLVSDGAG